MQKLTAFIIIISLFNLCGCWNRIEVNDSVAVSGIGIDLSGKDQITFSTQFNRPINPQQNQEIEGQFEVYSSHGDSVAEAARRTMLIVPRLPLWSHADIFILGETLAEKDLFTLMDFLARNRNVRLSADIVLAKDASPEKILSTDCPLALCSARGILKIIRNQEKTLGIYTPVTLEEFLYKLATPGIDPVIPQVSISKDVAGKNILTMYNSAVFKDRHKVGELNTWESRGYHWLTAGYHLQGFLPIKTARHPDEIVTLNVVRQRAKMRPEWHGDNIHIKIYLDVIVDIAELYPAEQALSANEAEQIANAAELEIKRQIAACIKKAQELNADILGFGLSINRYRPEEWQKIQNQWYQIYPDIETDIKVNIRVDSANMLKTSLEIK